MRRAVSVATPDRERESITGMMAAPENNDLGTMDGSNIFATECDSYRVWRVSGGHGGKARMNTSRRIARTDESDVPARARVLPPIAVPRRRGNRAETEVVGMADLSRPSRRQSP